jgi:probable rRNA maturation factor
MTSNVSIYCELPQLYFREAEIIRLCAALDASTVHPIHSGELSIAFVKCSTMIDLHSKYMNDINMTDVITFQGSNDEDFAGEICISPEYAHSHIMSHGGNFSEEITLYIVHGWLHLAGLDDVTPKDALCMRNAERQLMDIVFKAKCVPKFSMRIFKKLNKLD